MPYLVIGVGEFETFEDLYVALLRRQWLDTLADHRSPSNRRRRMLRRQMTRPHRTLRLMRSNAVLRLVATNPRFFVQR